MTTSRLPPLPAPISFASELIKARNDLGLTQNQLASSSGLSLSALKGYESGRNMPGSRELRDLCQALSISPNKLLFGTELPFVNLPPLEDLTKDLNEVDHVAATKILALLAMLSSDERNAVMTLAKSIAVARLGESEVRNQLGAYTFTVGIFREMVNHTSAAMKAGKPVDPDAFAKDVENFADRNFGSPPKKTPKK